MEIDEAIEELYKILRERDMPAYPIAAKNDGVCYTDYLTGAHASGPYNVSDKDEKYVYTPSRNRQCSIGYHEECTDSSGKKCGCPCHRIVKLLKSVASGR